MKQKEIWLVSLDPTEGSEIYGTRPVVVISGPTMNTHSRLRIVCPLTSKIKHRQSCVVVFKNEKNGLEMDSEILPFQIRTVDKNRGIQKFGEITDAQLQAVKAGFSEVITY